MAGSELRASVGERVDGVEWGGYVERICIIMVSCWVRSYKCVVVGVRLSPCRDWILALHICGNTDVTAVK